jgi:putative phosphoribosyl transferase
LSVTTKALAIDVDAGTLEADLALPQNARGVVLFAHGSGSSRRSPRNRYVAGRLHLAGFGTLLLDLLTPREQLVDERTRELRFDVPLLAGRLRTASGALAGDASLPPWRGYFGASTGAAAALVAAAGDQHGVDAVVSRGGRPDLAGDALAQVRAPTLLIVGGYDSAVLELNEQALRRLECIKELAVVPRATHLFEEPGALDDVCDHATAWFDRHCPVRRHGIRATT